MWKLCASVVALLLAVTGCTSTTPSRVAVSVGGTPSAAGSASTPAPEPGGASSLSTHSVVVASRRVAYGRGTATVRAYLDTWKHHGLQAANQRFLASPPGQGAAGPGLISGRLVRFRPVSWTSPGHFTLVVDLTLRFQGHARAWAAWGQGTNTRFVTFTKAPQSPTGYRMSLATSP